MDLVPSSGCLVFSDLVVDNTVLIFCLFTRLRACMMLCCVVLLFLICLCSDNRI